MNLSIFTLFILFCFFSGPPWNPRNSSIVVHGQRVFGVPSSTQTHWVGSVPNSHPMNVPTKVIVHPVPSPPSASPKVAAPLLSQAPSSFVDRRMTSTGASPSWTTTTTQPAPAAPRHSFRASSFPSQPHRIYSSVPIITATQSQPAVHSFTTTSPITTGNTPHRIISSMPIVQAPSSAPAKPTVTPTTTTTTSSTPSPHRIVTSVPVIQAPRPRAPDEVHVILEEDWKQSILALHNKARDNFSTRERMHYHPTLALRAQDSAKKSSERCAMTHIRSDNLFEAYYDERRDTGVTKRQLVMEGVKVWSDEEDTLHRYVSQYRPDFLLPQWDTTNKAKALKYFYPLAKMQLGHLHQMVWKNTTHVGCAYAINKACQPQFYLACVYDPPGNVRGFDFDGKRQGT